MGIDLAMVRPPRCLLVNVTTGESMECLFNPTQLTEKVQVKWNRLVVPGLSHQVSAAVLPPRFNTVRYGGVLAPAAKWRALVVPPPPPPAEDESTTEQDVAPPARAPSQPDKPSTHRSGWWLRAELMKRCFQLEVDKCSACGGRMKRRALVTKPASVRRLLRHLGEPTEAPPLAPARAPPFYRAPVVRRRTHQPSPPRQVEMLTARGLRPCSSTSLDSVQQAGLRPLRFGLGP